MGSDDSGVHLRVLVIRVFPKSLKHSLPEPTLRPADVAGINFDGVSEALGEVSPRDSRSITLENRLDEQAIVFRGHPNRPWTTGE